MSDLTDKLKIAADTLQGGNVEKLLRWAIIHIESQDEALEDLREELSEETDNRIRMENQIHSTAQALKELADKMKYTTPVNIPLSRDYAPHINVMASHGIDKKRKGQKAKKANDLTTSNSM